MEGETENEFMRRYRELEYKYRNGIKGFYLLKKAAEQGDAEAMAMLYSCYTHGVGCIRDESKGFLYIKQAAELGNDFAQCQYGSILLETGGENKFDEAMMWIKRAADNGNYTGKIIYAKYVLKDKKAIVETGGIPEEHESLNNEIHRQNGDIKDSTLDAIRNEAEEGFYYYQYLICNLYINGDSRVSEEEYLLNIGRMMAGSLGKDIIYDYRSVSLYTLEKQIDEKNKGGQL